jgi:hypothetical protein
VIRTERRLCRERFDCDRPIFTSSRRCSPSCGCFTCRRSSWTPVCEFGAQANLTSPVAFHLQRFSINLPWKGVYSRGEGHTHDRFAVRWKPWDATGDQRGCHTPRSLSPFAVYDWECGDIFLLIQSRPSALSLTTTSFLLNPLAFLWRTLRAGTGILLASHLRTLHDDKPSITHIRAGSDDHLSRIHLEQ